MFGIHYLKTGPTQHVIHYSNGRVRRSGPGLAFFYYQPASSIVVVPIGSADVPFIFSEISADFQPVTVQGQITYRVQDPELVASLLDYRIDRTPESYKSEDSEKLPQRLVNLAQEQVRLELEHLPLRRAIHASDEVARAVFARLSEGNLAASLGVEVLVMAIQAIKPTPEMARALEAEARESLLMQADSALYDRRNSAVNQERRIKENELETEVAVEEKRRLIRERKVEADLAVEAKEQQVREARLAGQIQLEEDRKRLVAVQVENSRTAADAEAYAVAATLQPLRELDDATLQAITMQSAEPKRMIAFAMRDLAANAARIGSLHISPDLLESLLTAADQN